MPSLTMAAEGTTKFVDLSVDIWHWVALVAFVVVLLLIDLLVVHRRPHAISIKEAAVESAIWISIGLSFSGVIFLLASSGQGSQAVAEYLAAFLIEKSLSVDNVFVWAVIFSYFSVPSEYQFRVLFWGVFGAIVMRAVFIFAGVALLETFAATLAVFGAILLYTAFKLAFQGETRVDPDRSIALRTVRKVVPSTEEMHGQHLFTKENGRRVATPLFAVLIMIEATDIVFAIDSIPAIFGVTQDVFVVFSAVTFAVLGLRALYFLVGGMQDRFRYLNYGLALILAFVGVKLILAFTADAFSWPSEDFHIPIWVSLSVIATTLTVAIVASLRADNEDRERGSTDRERGSAGRK